MFIGSPKQPTITICTLEGQRYKMEQFRGDARIVSRTFPNLELTANEIIAAGQ